jgi:hypothetical protein
MPFRLTVSERTPATRGIYNISQYFVGCESYCADARVALNVLATYSVTRLR